MTKQALILIDIQNDYFEGGAMSLKEPVKAAENARKLLHHFRQNGKAIVHVQHLAATPELGFMLEGTDGQKIHSSVTPLEGEPVITKHYPNSFAATNLSDVLNELEVTEVVLVGMMTHMCVSSTARATIEYGLKTIIAHDACATCDLSIFDQTIAAQVVHQTALAEVANIADILSVEEVIRR
ncbi:cysteine hydrolase family protein [Vibrio panuliri]|uniref:Isochorismatase n=1 Tax=Vibrio panuliri TaxID=1381081 RepID=A0ABX3F5U5_9VIBR|nr:cysteine hydrolase family protein [Vibrio panuliri]KAB1458259.1 cysteine hydrolase [Vibrio panuliri]OLQ84954.1 isochorismatase [Vibrio panuliri]